MTFSKGIPGGKSLRKVEHLALRVLPSSSQRGLQPCFKTLGISGSTDPNLGVRDEGYEDQKFLPLSHAAQRLAFATWGSMPRNLVMFAWVPIAYITTFPRTTATSALPPRCAAAAFGRAWKTQMRAERSSPTPLGFELALEKPWHGEPPAKRTCSTVYYRRGWT